MEARRVHYAVKAVDGSHLVTVATFRSLEQALKLSIPDDRVLSIWAVSESQADARLVAVRNRGDEAWTVIETPLA